MERGREVERREGGKSELNNRSSGDSPQKKAACPSKFNDASAKMRT